MKIQRLRLTKIILRGKMCMEYIVILKNLTINKGLMCIHHIFIYSSFSEHLVSFGYPGSSVFLIKFQDYLSQFCGKYPWQFDRACIEPVDCFGQAQCNQDSPHRMDKEYQSERCGDRSRGQSEVIAGRRLQAMGCHQPSQTGKDKDTHSPREPPEGMKT